MNRASIRKLVTSGETTTVRQEILARLLSGNRMRWDTLGTTSADSLRGRLSELRTLGYSITHEKGYVQLVGIKA